MKKKIGKRISTILIVLIFLAGIGIMLYPTVSMKWNAGRQSRVVAVYDETVAAMSRTDYSEYLEAAEEYNRKLAGKAPYVSLGNTEADPEYQGLLNVSGNGVMGYITIDKINVNLPIYHTTSDSALSAGAGHLQGTSLPVGGESTHAVISAHRGLPSARMFTDLDKMDIGDTFDIHVLGDTLRYQVDQIITVLPTETEELRIKPGKDYCTLMTCTPYGVNTHRLFVRGTRIPYTEDAEEEKESAGTVTDAGGFNKTILIIGAGMLIFVLAVSEIIVIILRNRRKHKNKKTGEEQVKTNHDAS